MQVIDVTKVREQLELLEEIYLLKSSLSSKKKSNCVLVFDGEEFDLNLDEVKVLIDFRFKTIKSQLEALGVDLQGDSLNIKDTDIKDIKE